MPRWPVPAVEFENVPSFVDRLDAAVEVAGLGTIAVDVAYGGMFYAIVDATKLGFRVDASELASLRWRGTNPAGRPSNWTLSTPRIREFGASRSFSSPVPFEGIGKVTRNTCIVAPGRSDRSPTGTAPAPNGRSSCPRPDGCGRNDDSRIADRISISRTHHRDDVGRRPAGDHSRHQGTSLDHRVQHYLLDPDDPYPAGLSPPR